MRRRFDKLEVKYRGLTPELPLILLNQRVVAVGGMYGVAVKCLEIIQNTDREDRFPECN